MKVNNPFVGHVDTYVRDIDPLEASLQQAAMYLSRTRDRPYDACLAFVRKTVGASGARPVNDPTVYFLSRQQNGDRVKKTSTFSEYLKFVISHKLVMVPTMTVYFNPHQRRSYLAEYIELNVALRDHHKHLMFDAKERGNTAVAQFEDNNQTTTKYKNNSLSGAQLSPFTPLFNKSGHSTLTSTCRTTTSYANANNEWFLTGNRHYWHPNTVMAHITTMLMYTDFKMVQDAVDTFNLHIPTVNQVMDVVRWSSRFYWNGRGYYNDIEQYISTLSDIERCAFVYIGDMHHLAIYNEDFMRCFFTDMSRRSSVESSSPKEHVSLVDEDVVGLATLLCASDMRGRKLKTVIEEKDTHTYGVVASTCNHIRLTLEKYRLLIEGLWRPAVLPPSIAYLPAIKRRCVIASDTDSTIFTTQRWTMWFTDGELFTPKCYDIGYTTTYLTNQMIKHKLAQMSSNIGMVKEHLFKTEMKNEFYFPIFSLTNMAKHYFAYRSAQEGLILKKLESEIKGVNLRDSTVSVEIMGGAKTYMHALMDGVMAEGTVTLASLHEPIVAFEKKISDDLNISGFNYLKAVQVKDLESYIQKEEAPNIQHHKFWNEVFAPKYGEAPVPPYDAVRISVDLPNKRSLQMWIDSIQDIELAIRLRDWIQANGKNYLTTMVLPVSNLEVSGMPPEIASVVHERKILSTTMNAFYIVLESAGIHMRNKHFTKLVSDSYIKDVTAA